MYAPTTCIPLQLAFQTAQLEVTLRASDCPSHGSYENQNEWLHQCASPGTQHQHHASTWGGGKSLVREGKRERKGKKLEEKRKDRNEEKMTQRFKTIECVRCVLSHSGQ